MGVSIASKWVHMDHREVLMAGIARDQCKNLWSLMWDFNEFWWTCLPLLGWQALPWPPMALRTWTSTSSDFDSHKYLHVLVWSSTKKGETRKVIRVLNLFWITGAEGSPTAPSPRRSDTFDMVINYDNCWHNGTMPLMYGTLATEVSPCTCPVHCWNDCCSVLSYYKEHQALLPSFSVHVFDVFTPYHLDYGFYQWYGCYGICEATSSCAPVSWKPLACPLLFRPK